MRALHHGGRGGHGTETIWIPPHPQCPPWWRVAVLLLLGTSPAFAQPTFTKDIAPIVWSRCATCHRPGEIGPFSLITYDEVKRHATQIAVVTARRVMPPWKPISAHGEFQNERRLSDPELQTPQQWIADRPPEGDRP